MKAFLTRELVERLTAAYQSFIKHGRSSVEGNDACEVKTLLDSAVAARTKTAFENVERRIKRLEQFQCEHVFKNESEGCLDSLFCVKCGALRPDWESVPKPAMQQVAMEQHPYIYWEPVDSEAIYIKDTWYRPKKREE